MSTAIVKTQTELDTALADDSITTIEIRSERGVWLRLNESGSATVWAYGSATVEAYGSATVEASDSATVRASGSATVWASGSATVWASGSATVRAYGSATVRASDSATVRASGSATVEASGSATVRASDSATVRAYGSATVRASDSATVEAGSHVAVHLFRATATVTGGVVIDVTNAEDTAESWAAYHGVAITDGTATVYKAVDDNLRSGYGFTYPIGETVTDPAWTDNHECGGGLHFSPTPAQARTYFTEATRFLECTVPVAELRQITGGTAKCKARTATVVREVTIDGEDMAS